MFLSVLLLAWGAISTQAQPAQSGWPTFKGNPQNTARSAGFGANGAVKWNCIAPTGITSVNAMSPVLGANGDVVFDFHTVLYDVDVKTGKINWTCNNMSDFGYPAVAKDGSIYANQVSGFVALDGLSGALEATYPSFFFLGIGPDGTLYGTSAGVLNAIDPVSKATKWTAAVDAYYNSVPGFASDGTIYVSGTTPGGAFGGVVALSPTDGSILWSHQDDYLDYESPTVGPDGTVYASGNSWLSAFDGASGRQKWVIGMAGGVLGMNPDGTVLYVLGLNGIEAVDSTNGMPIWQTDIQGGYGAVSADGTIYTQDFNETGTAGNLYALDGSSGTVMWSVPTYGAVSSPALGPDGVVYAGTGTGLIAVQSISVVSIALSPSTVPGGNNSTGTITLNMAAPKAGFIAMLKSDNPAAMVPSAVTVPAGQTTATFIANSAIVPSQVVANITATPGIAQTATLTINPPVLLSTSPSSPVICRKIF